MQQSNHDDDDCGMLVRTLPVRVLDLSHNGCLVEVARHLETGTNGQLQIVLDGAPHIEDVRVCRCGAREGASRVQRAGVEFLSTRPLSRRSLRVALRRLIIEVREPSTDIPREAGARRNGGSRDMAREARIGRAPPVTVDA